MPKVLLIEDEEAIRDMIRFALSRAKMECWTVPDIAEAQRLLAKKQPDLILLDWMLPDGSGIFLLKELRKNPESSHIPVIMLTAMATENNKIQGLEAGADDYITKPFSPKELIARIRAVLRRAAGMDQQGLRRYHQLIWDESKHQIYWQDQPINLSPTEYRLLGFLIAHPERVYSRNQLLDYVWPDDEEREERTVDVSIRRLRKALKPLGGDALIQTVRGLGYRLSKSK